MLAKLELSFWLKSIIDLMEVAKELIDLVVSIVVALEALEALEAWVNNNSSTSNWSAILALKNNLF